MPDDLETTAPADELRARLAHIRAYVTDRARFEQWEATEHPLEAYHAVLQWVAAACDIAGPLPEERLLTRQEQGLLHGSLRRSLRIIG